MKRATFMSIAAIVSFLFGVAFLIVPVQLMTLYGVTLDPSGEYIGRYFGSALLGVSFINWFGRNAKGDNEALRAIILGSFILCLTGFVAALFDVFLGVGNSVVWSTVGIYFLLAIGFGYFQFKK